MSDQMTEALTFLFTDIEGSTKLWQTYPQAMKVCLARHDHILRAAIEENNGLVFKTVGDPFYAVFSRPSDAIDAAIKMQFDLQAEDWCDVGELKVRVALHTGEAERRAGDYFGMSLNLVARLLSAGYGGQILSAEEQGLWQRLSVFAGGCTLEAARAVCGEGGEAEADFLGGLASLVDNSLLRREEEEREPRFSMLETIREYGQQRLSASGEAGSRLGRHAGFFLGLAEKAEPELTGSQQAVWLQRLETEHDNMRGAMGWVLESKETELALRISAALQRFWSVRGHLSEGRSWLERALSLTKNETSLARARALRGAGNLAWRQADFPLARRFHEESLAINRHLGDKKGIASTLNNLANVAAYQGEYPRARAYLEESLALYKELGDRTNMAVTLTNLGVVEEHQDEYDRARSMYQESLAICRELGDSSRVALNLYNLGTVATCQGDFSLAKSCCQESLTVSRELEDNRNAAFALGQLAEIALYGGNRGRRPPTSGRAWPSIARSATNGASFRPSSGPPAWRRPRASRRGQRGC